MGYPHQRKIKFMNHTLRDDIDHDLRESLRASMTLASLNPHLNIIEHMLGTDEEVVVEDKNTNMEVIKFEYPLSNGGTVKIEIPKEIEKSDLKIIISLISGLKGEK